MIPKEIKLKALLFEARRWVGVTEQGGNNKGQLVEIFQRAVDGKAQGEAWCMAAVQFMVQKVDELYEAIFDDHFSEKTSIFKSEHCLTVWAKTPLECRLSQPVPGCIVIWAHTKDGVETGAGHTGIVESVSGPYMNVLEGNTGADLSDGSVNREGDGYYRKTRRLSGNGTMKVKGYLAPWP